MTLPWVFANLASGNQPASKLDDNFNALGTISTVPCTATGTTNYTLTPVAGTPTISAYNQLQALRAVIPATSTGVVTAGLSGPGLLPCYRASSSGPVAAGTGDVVIGEVYDFIYDIALAGGTGGFHLYNVVSGGGGGGGSFVSISFAELTAYTTCATVVPYDDSIPTNTEGVQILTLTATTTTSTQVIYLDVTVLGYKSGGTFGVVLLNDTTTLAAEFTTVNSVTPNQLARVYYKFTPGAAATYTFNVRCGPGAAPSVFINGTASARIGGGSQRGATITATVIEP